MDNDDDLEERVQELEDEVKHLADMVDQLLVELSTIRQQQERGTRFG